MGLTILVVDDDVEIRTVLKQVCIRRGHTVLEADDGDRALEQISKVVPDAISLDIQMPRVDGRDVVNRLKQDPKTRDVPLVIVTARDDEYTREHCLELGADDVIEKPFDANHLVGQLEYLASKRRGEI